MLKTGTTSESDTRSWLQELFPQPWKGLRGPLAEDGDQESGRRSKGLQEKGERAEFTPTAWQSKSLMSLS